MDSIADTAFSCRDDDKKKKHRASQSQEYIKTENGAGRSVSVASDTGMPMVKSGTKKRRSTDESLNGNKRLNRGTGSRASSITREPLNTNLADSSPPVRRQQMQSALPLETEKPPLFPSDPTDATAVRQDQADSRGKLVKALRENQFQVSQSQEMYGHGRTSSMPDSSPYSYTSTSPTTSVSNGPLGFIENQTYGVITESRHRTMRSSTPATMTGTPPMSSIPHAIGEDPRHLDLPGPPKLFRLMEAYFENVYSQTYAFLHRKTFMENLENHPLVLLFSMCAVAARFSDYASSETVYAARARELIMLNYDSYTLEVVQSMVNMGLHDFGSNNGHKAWMFAGMAVRMGAALNMNLENRKKEKNKNVIAKECARRTYWSYYLMDVRAFFHHLHRPIY